MNIGERSFLRLRNDRIARSSDIPSTFSGVYRVVSAQDFRLPRTVHKNHAETVGGVCRAVRWRGGRFGAS